jgi:hypothetical protein
VGSVQTGRRPLRGPAPTREVPQGEIHAYAAGEEQTACGVSLDTLHLWEDEPFWRVLHACPRCQALVRIKPEVIDLTVFDRDRPREVEIEVEVETDHERSSADRN